MSNTYPALVFWSDDDGAYLAIAPQLQGCIAHGETRQEAMENLEDAVESWLESAKEEGWALPKPQHSKDISKRASEGRRLQKQKFEEAVKHALAQILPEIVPQVATEMAKQMLKDMAKSGFLNAWERSGLGLERQSFFAETLGVVACDLPTHRR